MKIDRESKTNDEKIQKQKNTKTPKYRFSVKNLVVIAILCSLGGVMSTYVKYIANIINIGFGVPFGAAQLVAGLHVIWLILCYGLVRKFGTGTISGFLKGIIELFTGNPHGITVVLISGIEGIFIDLGMAAFRRKHAIYSYGISAGLAAASEVFVFYPIFFPYMPIWFMVATSSLAFGSGLVFGGFFGKSTLELIHMSKIAKIPGWQPEEITMQTRAVESVERSVERPEDIDIVMNNKPIKNLRRPMYIATIIFILFFIIGGVVYYATIPTFFNDKLTCSIEGNVEEPYDYDPDDFKENKTTIKTDLVGSYTIEGEKEYIGVPLHIIINHSKPKNDTKIIEVIGSDGYSMEFDWEKVRTDDRLILIVEDGKLRLIAGDYDLSYSVKLVQRIVVK